LFEDVIAHREGCFKSCFFRDGGEQAVVGDDQSIYLFAELLDALARRSACAARPQTRRFSDNAHRERTELFSGLGNDRCCARAGAAAHTARHKDHVGAFDGLLNFFFSLLSGAFADLWVHPGTKAAGEIFANMDLLFSERLVEVLGVGVDGDKVDAAHLALDHVIDGVIA
jgi:hypothetical protein